MVRTSNRVIDHDERREWRPASELTSNVRFYEIRCQWGTYNSGCRLSGHTTTNTTTCSIRNITNNSSSRCFSRGSCDTTVASPMATGRGASECSLCCRGLLFAFQSARFVLGDDSDIEPTQTVVLCSS